MYGLSKMHKTTSTKSRLSARKSGEVNNKEISVPDKILRLLDGMPFREANMNLQLALGELQDKSIVKVSS